MTGSALWDSSSSDSDPAATLRAFLEERGSEKMSTLGYHNVGFCPTAVLADEAVRLAGPGNEHHVHQWVNQRKHPAWNIDLTRRPPGKGPVTHHDLHVDQDRVAAVLAEGLRGPRVPTTRGPQPLHSQPRQFGKTSSMERDLQQWAAAFEAATGRKPQVARVSRRSVAADLVQEYWPDAGVAQVWLSVDAMLEELREQDRAERFRREYLGQWAREDPEPPRGRVWYESKVVNPPPPRRWLTTDY